MNMLVSLCAIAKNEAGYLPGMLRNFERLADEFCVVDTGSIDGTLQVAHPKLRVEPSAEFTPGAPQEQFHFGRARDESLAMARGEWILACDPDWRLQPQMVKALRGFFEAGRFAKFDVLACAVLSGGEVTCRPRFWRRSLGLQFDDAAHEAVAPPKGSRGMNLTNIVFEHLRAAADADPAEARRKHEFYAAILETQRKNEPDKTSVLWKLAVEFKCLGRCGRAIPLFERVLEKCRQEPAGESFMAWQMTMLASCYVTEGRALAAVEQLEKALELRNIAYANWLMGGIYESCGRLDLAERWYRTALLTPPPTGAFWMDVPEYRGAKAHAALDRVRRKATSVTTDSTDSTDREDHYKGTKDTKEEKKV